MNRLILLGNGFDLAHGLKTSYISFIKWYLKECFFAGKGGVNSDALIEVAQNSEYRKPFTIDDVDFWLDDYFKNGFGDISKVGSPHLDNMNQRDVYPFKVTVQSAFLTALLEQCSIKRWVDVEAIFYDELTIILEGADSQLSKNYNVERQEEQLIKLNGDMRFVISKLEKYLLSIDKAPYIEEYQDIINSMISIDDLDSITYKKVQQSRNKHFAPIDTLILNFNYTDTVEQYIELTTSDNSKPKVNFIHGQLSSSNNPIVFGFGDELDEKYLLMEREKAKGYFEHIKSFWYFRTSKYRELVRFVDSGSYQVLILGHSCGLSDRTMLHMILEHDNCKSVKIYYHGNQSANNYTDITHEIARHFTDKSKLRDRIVSLDNSTNMPQAGK